MKKLLFLFMLWGATLHLKAQSVPIQPYSNFQLKPFNKLPDSFYKKYQYKTPDSLKATIPPYQQLVASNIKINTPTVSPSTYDHMPIIKMNGNSKMPIIKMPGNSKMPVINPNAPVIIEQPEKP